MEKKMVQGVSQSAEWCYQAGRNWGNDRFEPHWWTLVQGLDDEHKVKARINWPGPRKYSPFFTQETPNTYFQYDEKGREGWYRLIGYCDTQLFLDLQPSEFRTLAKAYELVRDKIEDNAISFYDGLNQVLEDGTVREWSQHIIDHYQKPTIGGDTYERVS